MWNAEEDWRKYSLCALFQIYKRGENSTNGHMYTSGEYFSNLNIPEKIVRWKQEKTLH